MFESETKVCITSQGYSGTLVHRVNSVPVWDGQLWLVQLDEPQQGPGDVTVTHALIHESNLEILGNGQSWVDIGHVTDAEQIDIAVAITRRLQEFVQHQAVVIPIEATKIDPPARRSQFLSLSMYEVAWLVMLIDGLVTPESAETVTGAEIGLMRERLLHLLTNAEFRACSDILSHQQKPL